jgi:hypothetical protein
MEPELQWQDVKLGGPRLEAAEMKAWERYLDEQAISNIRLSDGPFGGLFIACCGWRTDSAVVVNLRRRILLSSKQSVQRLFSADHLFLDLSS